MTKIYVEWTVFNVYMMLNFSNKMGNDNES